MSKEPDPNSALNCPFCGGRPQVIERNELNFAGGDWSDYIVQCKKIRCPIKPTTTMKRTLEDALEAWNTRDL